jgi:cyclophilin family peptidyl-prolyl cis-trans isomerase
MSRLIPAIWNRFLSDNRLETRPKPSSRRSRPTVEILEDRTTPSISASGVLNGIVFSGGGNSGLAGVNVTLTGTTTTGSSVKVSEATDSTGAFNFNQLLPGTYALSSAPPSGFVAGNPSGVTGIALAAGQTVTIDLRVGGLSPSGISLAYFLASASGTPRFTVPTPGAGSAAGFTLDSANPLTNQSIIAGTTSFLDLSGNFLDPNTTNGTVVTFNTSQGSFNVTLFDKDAPQTVTNFLDYVQAGDYTNDLFHRLSNLSQTSPINPPPTPFQVLQGGGFTVKTDASNNITGFTALTTFQPIQNESNDALHPNALGTLSMARGSAVNSATGQFFFNLTDNSQGLSAAAGNGFTVFGAVTGGAGTTALQNFANNYTPRDETTATGQSSFFALPLVKGFTPASNFPTGATTSDLAEINSVTVSQPPTGQLTYAIVGNSKPSVVAATLGANTSTSTFSANQLQLIAKTAGTSVISIQITDIKGESVIKQFTVTVS